MEVRSLKNETDQDSRISVLNIIGAMARYKDSPEALILAFKNSEASGLIGQATDMQKFSASIQEEMRKAVCDFYENNHPSYENFVAKTYGGQVIEVFSLVAAGAIMSESFGVENYAAIVSTLRSRLEGLARIPYMNWAV